MSTSVNGRTLGRPTKRSPEIIAKISEALSFGMTQRDIADLIDVDKDTLTEWYKDPIFSVQVKGALAERKITRLRRIDAGIVGWQGSAWMMERCFPQEYCRPELKIAIQHDVTVNVNHNVNIMPESELLRLLATVKEVEAELLPEAPPSEEGIDASE